MKRSMVFSLVVGVLLTGNEPASAQTDEPARHDLLRRLEHQEQARRQRIEQLRLAGKQNLEENRFSAPTILYDILPTGEPLFFTTCNLTAAQNVGTQKLWTGGELQLNLEGSNLTIGLWDAGAVRATHQEFTGRVSQIDNVGFLYTSGSNHATHVSGTLLAAGISPQARGMAKEARLWAYDWNGDVPEMAQAAAAGLLISNHSYGYSAWGMPQWMFGFYDQYAANWDEITYTFPYYLPVKAAGNDGGSGYNSADGGYDLLLGASNAKNALVVGAVYGDNYTGPESVRIAPFSSWGPTDDGRIKPDLVAPGVNLYSAGAAADNAYAYGSGTSMATPVVTGSLALLQEYYRRLYGSYMQAATLRALVIHTAREAGSAPGPDYIHGWGLLNAEKAALTIQEAATTGGALIEERTLNDGATYVFSVTALGTSPLEVTICWTDPAGTPPPTNVEDPTDLMLVNDLDVRVSDGSTTYLPWVLDPALPAAAATTGDNFRDNVEKIYIASPTPGATYTITVSHKGILSGGAQDYSLIVTGILAPSVPLVSFTANLMNTVEVATNPSLPGDCRAYTDILIPVRITGVLTLDNTLGITLGGSAIEGVDYDVITPFPLTLLAGITGYQNIILRVYDDHATEAAEEVIITLNINAGDASLGAYPSIVIKIADNDLAPAPPATSGVLLFENFEGALTGWTAFSNISSANNWYLGNSYVLNGSRSVYISDGTGVYDKTSSANVLLISPVIDATAYPYSDLQLSFLMLCNGEAVGSTYYDYGSVVILDEAMSYYTVIGGPYQGITSVSAQTINIPAQFKGTRFRIAFWWINDGSAGSDPAFVVDDVQVQALPFAGTPVQYSVSANPPGNTYYFGPNDTLYVRDSDTGNLIARLENLSNHNYGCTQVYVDRAGTGATNFIDTNPANAATDKSLRIIPANNNPTGNYRIRLYFSNAEIAGWEAITGNSFTTDMQIVKYPGAIASASNPSLVSYASSLQRGNYGSADRWIEGTFFNGFSGFAGQGGGFGPLPVELLSVQAQWADNRRVTVHWEVVDDTHISEYCSIKDSQGFVRVAGRRAGKAASRSAHGKVYEATDDVGNMPAGETPYYRLGMKTTDGKLSYSAAVTPGARAFDFAVYPTVVSGNVTIELPYLSESVHIQCIDVHGRSFDIEQVSLSGEGKRITSSMEQLPAGVYVLQLRYSNGQVLQKKIVKR